MAMIAVTAARHAMATRFEILLHGENEIRLRAAAEEALDEIERLDAQLSPYRPGSEISRINAHAGQGLVRIEPGLFALLQQAKRLSLETGGAFDLTVGPLMDCWGLSPRSHAGAHPAPDPEAIAAALVLTGMEKLHLDAAQSAAGLELPGMRLDMGAYGKGWAVERAGIVLREAGVFSGLINGGTSTVYGIGAPPDGDAWSIALEEPELAQRNRTWATATIPDHVKSGHPYRAVIRLKDEGLSVSATWGKEIGTDSPYRGHVIDPRLGHPVPGAIRAAVALPLASETDAFSTALLVAGDAGKDLLQRARPGVRVFVAS